MKSLFQVTTQYETKAPASMGVLADSLNSAINLALSGAGGAATLVNAFEFGGRPIDAVGASATGTNIAPKILYSVSFRNGSGPNGTNPASLLVLANATTEGTVTTAADTVAIGVAEGHASAVANAISVVGRVDLEA